MKSAKEAACFPRPKNGTFVACRVYLLARIAVASAIPRAAIAPSLRSGSMARARSITSSSICSTRATRSGSIRSPPVGSIRLPSKGACRNTSWMAPKARASSLSPLASAANSALGNGGGAPDQAMCGNGRDCQPPLLHAANATAKAAIWTHRPSISRPNKLLRRTAAAASVKKWPEPQQGSRTVIALASLGQPGKPPAAGRQRSSSFTKRSMSKTYPGGEHAPRRLASSAMVSASSGLFSKTLPTHHAPSVLCNRNRTM